MGLNEGYSQSRSQILMKTELFNVNQAYAQIIQDEDQNMVAGSNYTRKRNIDTMSCHAMKNKVQEKVVVVVAPVMMQSLWLVTLQKDKLRDQEDLGALDIAFVIERGTLRKNILN